MEKDKVKIFKLLIFIMFILLLVFLTIKLNRPNGPKHIPDNNSTGSPGNIGKKICTKIKPIIKSIPSNPKLSISLSSTIAGSNLVYGNWRTIVLTYIITFSISGILLFWWNKNKSKIISNEHNLEKANN